MKEFKEKEIREIVKNSLQNNIRLYKEIRGKIDKETIRYVVKKDLEQFFYKTSTSGLFEGNKIVKYVYPDFEEILNEELNKYF